MIDSTEQDLTLSVPLTLQLHHAALLFYQQHSDPHKAKQVYLNTLAVSAVRAYLSWLGIATDLQASDSWNPTIQALADVADLEIPGQGKLECRPVLPEATVCYVAPETWSNRIGYIPVLLDAELQTATLLGFVPKVDTAELPLDRLQSLVTLLDMLGSQAQPQQNKELVNLSQWAQGIFTKSWQAVEELLEPQPLLSFRSLELSGNLKPSGLTTRGKILELVPRSLSHQVVLLVGLIPNNSLQLDIWVKLYPTSCDSYLPENLEIKVLDEHKVAVMQAQSRHTDMLQLNFQGMVGEQFSIELGLNDINLIETFVI